MNKLNYWILLSALFLFFPFQTSAAEPYKSSRSCSECHEDIYNKWKNSLHANAVNDPIFFTAYQEAYYLSKGKAKFICLPCHAPTVNVTKDFDLEMDISKEGVTCDFCHTLKDVISDKNPPFVMEPGKTKRGPLKIAESLHEHDNVFSPLHTSSKLCAGCHEYRVNGVAVMETYSEWKSSPYARGGKECQDCHMPLVKGQIAKSSENKREINEHNLQGGNSVEQLREAVEIQIEEVKREGVQVMVTVRIVNKGAGHKLPTGIPTRKLFLICDVNAGKNKIYSDKRVYEKVIIDAEGKELEKDSEIMLGYGREIIKDNRLDPKEIRFEKFYFYIPEEQKISVSARVIYSYTPLTVQSTDMTIEVVRVP